MKLRRKKTDDAPRRRRQDGENDNFVEEDAGRTLFRRGRTLVGSVSSQVSSASELSGELKSSRVHAHHLTRHRRRLGSYFLIVAVSICALAWFIYDFTAGIHVTSYSRTASEVQSARYEKAINDYFGSHPFERLRTLTDISGLTDYLRRVVPEVDEVKEIGPSDLGKSEFIVSFRQPVASWLIGTDLYYVDKNGMPFRTNYFAAPEVKIVDKSGVPQVAGTVVASGRFLRFVGLAVDTSRVFGMTVKQAVIPENTTRQVVLVLDKKSYPIKLSLDRPVGEQIEDMKKAVDYLHQKHVKPKYIDVRVSGKAYYK